jgi:hypothetical protein
MTQHPDTVEETGVVGKGTDEFVAELRSWLDDNLPEGWGTPGFRMGKGAAGRRSCSG